MTWRFCKSTDSLLFNFLFYYLFGQDQSWWALTDKWNGGVLEPGPLPCTGTQEPGRAAIQSSFPLYQLENCFHQGNWDPNKKAIERKKWNPCWTRHSEAGSSLLSYRILSRDQFLHLHQLEHEGRACSSQSPQFALPVKFQPAIFPSWCRSTSLSSKWLAGIRTNLLVILMSLIFFGCSVKLCDTKILQRESQALHRTDLEPTLSFSMKMNRRNLDAAFLYEKSKSVHLKT